MSELFEMLKGITENITDLNSILDEEDTEKKIPEYYYDEYVEKGTLDDIWPSDPTY